MLNVGDRVMIKARGAHSYGRTGRIVKIDEDHYEGIHHRPVAVKMDDGVTDTTGQWKRKELKKIYRHASSSTHRIVRFPGTSFSILNGRILDE